MPPRPVVHVVDDDEAIRDSLSFLLEAHGFQPVIHASANAFLRAAPDLDGACVLTDVRMPGMSGLDLVRALSEQGPLPPVIVMTGHGDVPLAVEAMKAGVVDFIEKPFSDDGLIMAVKAALVAPSSLARRDQLSGEALQRLAELSPRERDVLQGVIAGKANKTIAHELAISPRTVEVYRAHLMSKSGARSLSDLMRIALAAGL